MSDILEKLILVEKKATELVAEAEAEAARRKSAVRAEAGRAYAEAIRKKAGELDSLVEGRKAEFAREREGKNEKYLSDLASRGLHSADFLKVLEPLIGMHR
jgi:vacuolar-type H+-ATPase subunit H